MDDNGLTPEVQAELVAFAARHRHDAPLSVWRAADADALPDPVQASLAASLAASPWRQQIVAGATDATAESSLSDSDAAALLERIHRAAIAPAPTVVPKTRRLARFILPLVAAAAVVLVALRIRPAAGIPTSTTPPEAAAPTGTTPPVPSFVIPLEAAPVKLTPSALVRRSPSNHGVFTDDAVPAFAAYRAGRFDEAAAAFARLSTSYPTSPEAAFYLGVSRLLNGDASGAVTALTSARQINDPAFRDDVEWYLAAADERRGDLRAARAALAGLCQGSSAFSARACDAASRLPAK